MIWEMVPYIFADAPQSLADKPKKLKQTKDVRKMRRSSTELRLNSGVPGAVLSRGGVSEYWYELSIVVNEFV